jgi:hypothetical protein
VNRFYTFIGKHLPEIGALAKSLYFIVIGTYLAWYYDPVWLNRAGALVIIIGILLAKSRYPDWSQRRVMQLLDTNFEDIYNNAIFVSKECSNTLSDKDHAQLRIAFKNKLKEQSNAIYEITKSRLKNWEINTVIGGTILNGFGDLVVSFIKKLID